MRLIFLLLSLWGHIQAFSWQELEIENRLRLDNIAAMWGEAEDETGTYTASLLLMGSDSYGLATNTSDLDFAVVIAEHTTPNQYEALIEAFYRRCEKNNLPWDINGWHPPVSKLPSNPDSFCLLATPKQLASTRAKHLKTTLRYALYHPKFTGGNEMLYQEFLGDSDPASWGIVTRVELRKTGHYVERAKDQMKRLLRMQKKSHFIRIEVKGQWIKPTLELIQYLCMKHQIYTNSLYNSIESLMMQKVLPEHLGQEILDFLIFAIDCRRKFGKEIPVTSLKDSEINQFILFYVKMAKLLEICHLEINCPT